MILGGDGGKWNEAQSWKYKVQDAGVLFVTAPASVTVGRGPGQWTADKPLCSGHRPAEGACRWLGGGKVPAGTPTGSGVVGPLSGRRGRPRYKPDRYLYQPDSPQCQPTWQLAAILTSHSQTGHPTMRPSLLPTQYGPAAAVHSHSHLPLSARQPPVSRHHQLALAP